MRFWDEYKPARPHQWDGALADVRWARFDGLVAFAPPEIVAKAGALAGVIVFLIFLILPLSPVRGYNIVFTLPFLVLYSTLIALWRRRGVLAGKVHRLFNRDFYPHTLFTYVFMPLLPVLYMCLLPELSDRVSAGVDTFTGAMFMLMVFFWVGAFFDYLWEGCHNFALAWLHRSNPDAMHTHTLRMWLPREERERRFRLDELHYEDGRVYIRGDFENPAELRRKLLLLDFVREARVEQTSQTA